MGKYATLGDRMMSPSAYPSEKGPDHYGLRNSEPPEPPTYDRSVDLPPYRGPEVDYAQELGKALEDVRRDKSPLATIAEEILDLKYKNMMLLARGLNRVLKDELASDFDEKIVARVIHEWAERQLLGDFDNEEPKEVLMIEKKTKEVKVKEPKAQD